MNKQKVILYYKGPFEETILANISHFIRNKFADSPRVGAKLFSVFIELAQNIAFYSAETNYFQGENGSKGIGTIVVNEAGEFISLTTGNLVRSNEVAEIIEKCEQINKMSAEELRNLKKEIRKLPIKEGHKGGNIGLIQVALKSENPLTVESQPVDEEHSLFIVSTFINKQ